MGLTTLSRLPIGARMITIPPTLAEIAIQLGVRSVTTPATGRCIAMTIAQAVAGRSLDEQTILSSYLLPVSNKAYNILGRLHLEGQLAHDRRVNTLANVTRGWSSMTVLSRPLNCVVPQGFR